MKAKNTGLRIIYAAFLVILCFSWVIWFFLGKFVDTTNYENRRMHERPSLTLDTYQEFPSEFSSYLNDSIPFRNSLITLHNATDYFVFKKSSDSRVIIGADNWLFYNDKADGDPLACYQGTNLLTEEQLMILAENCKLQRNFLASQGIEFVIFIAPNKERIYSEYMPEQYGQPAEMYRALQIVQYLREYTDVRVVYPYEELMKAKEETEENIYYKTDTHWNSIGAYVGTRALLQELGVEMPELTSDELEIVKTEPYGGDLAGFLGLAQQLKDTEMISYVLGYDMHQMEALGGEYYEAYRYRASAGADPRKLYVVRDSFASAMFPFLGSQFSESCLRHLTTYSYEDVAEQAPDIFVYEIVERSCGNLASFSVQR